MKFSNITAADLSEEFGKNLDMNDVKSLFKKKDKTDTTAQTITQDATQQADTTEQVDTVKDATVVSDTQNEEGDNANRMNLVIALVVGLIAGGFIIHIAQKR